MEWDSFTVKRTLSHVLAPEYTALAFALVGVALWIVRGKRRAGLCLVLFGGIYLLVACLPITGFLLYRSLENRTSGNVDMQNLIRRGVRNIVVMGDVRDGVDIWKKLPGATLIISSGPYARVMAREARKMGVPEEATVVETAARDTGEQAETIKGMIGEEPFVLSTWAVHMWRALKTFRAEGLDPIPAPNHPVRSPRSLKEAITPSYRGWFMTKIGVHEYVGALAVVLKSLVEGSKPLSDRVRNH